MAGEIATIRKSFSETVNEIKSLEQQKKEIIPKPLEEEQQRIEVFSMDFMEALAELKRITLIKRLSKK